MTLEQAIHNLEQVILAFKGTWHEHMALQQSLNVVKDATKEEKPKQ